MRIPVDAGNDEIPDDVARLAEAVIAERQPSGDSDPPRSGPGQLRYLSMARSHPTEGLDLEDLTRHTPSLALVDQPAPVVLDRWLINAHAYSEEAAAKVGLFGLLFSGSADLVKAGVVHEAKRYSMRKTEQGRQVEIGVAIRLSVATTSFNSEFALTLPNLAADAQLHSTNTRIGITVIGYSGPLGDLLPAPRKLDVETCADYLQAFEKIQAIIFGQAGLQYLAPTVLSFDPD